MGSAGPDLDADLVAADAFQAAALAWVDPKGLGGVWLKAHAGPVRDAWLALFRDLAPEAAPIGRLPAGATEDRLLGGLDLAATLATGRPVLQPGVLAQADGGAVLVAMAERLPMSTAAVLCAALDRGAVELQRDGLQARLPCRLTLVALDESEGEDAPLPPSLADRLGLHLDLGGLRAATAVQADDAMRADVRRARERVAAVTVGDETVQALCAASLALGVDSARGAWLALCCARAAAALRGAGQVEEEDAALAARLVLAPRATRLPPSASEDLQEPERSPEPPPDAAPESPPDPPSEDVQSPAAEEVKPLEDRLVEASLAAMPPAVLASLASVLQERPRGARQAGRAGAASAGTTHGRPAGVRRGRPRAGARLHVLETLRAAAPWQSLRQSAWQEPVAAPGRRLIFRSDDFRLRRLEQRRTTTTVFAIDASGSSALHRMHEAKGAVESLLAECYVRRDQVAVIAFRGRGAELLLPPTRSLVRVRRSLAGLPGGGGTPLAAGLEAAAALAERVRRSGSTPVTVLLTDGRANVARDGQGGRERAREDALAAARRLRAQGERVLVIDTSVRPEPAALALAQAAGARYLPLPQADPRTVSRAVLRARGPD